MVINVSYILVNIQNSPLPVPIRYTRNSHKIDEGLSAHPPQRVEPHTCLHRKTVMWARVCGQCVWL